MTIVLPTLMQGPLTMGSRKQAFWASHPSFATIPTKLSLETSISSQATAIRTVRSRSRNNRTLQNRQYALPQPPHDLTLSRKAYRASINVVDSSALAGISVVANPTTTALEQPQYVALCFNSETYCRASIAPGFNKVARLLQDASSGTSRVNGD